MIVCPTDNESVFQMIRALIAAFDETDGNARVTNALQTRSASTLRSEILLTLLGIVTLTIVWAVNGENPSNL